jgi:hypothetical protein
MIGLHWSAVVPASSWAVALQQQRLPPADSVVVESPLPGGVAAITRFLLTTVPPWVQIGGLVVAAVVAAFVVRYLVRRRHAIRAWFAAQSRGVMWAIAAGTMVMVAGIVGMSAATWNYTQHSNEFCTSCHVMGTAFQKFSAAENKHGELSCHDCHQQSVFDSVWQLYVWIRERPDEIGQHSPVPNQVCETCHVTGDTARWQRIASTAGHRVHFESDSSTLDSLQCVTCHGVEVHRFKPVSSTCGQSGCHEAAETNIVLGKMAEQTASHCTNCHVFTTDVPALATRDSARGTLVPGRPQCFGCHDMKEVLPDFDEAKDPHGGKCGTCHNPHEHKTPGEAVQTCTTAACHANWREEPFHVGASHKRVAERCLTCHLPHQARVDASDCTGCHNNVRSRGNLRPPVPFDTTKALRRVSVTPTPAWPHETADSRQPPAGKTQPATPASSSAETIERPRRSGPAPDAAFAPEFSIDDSVDGVVRVSRPPPAAPDTFSHTRHAKLACLVCHQTASPNRRLTFERPRGCTICHHQASASASSRCASCHRSEEVAAAKAVAVTVTVPGHAPRARPVDFLHARHAQQTCTGCHTTAVTLAPAPAIAQCKNCHSEHHAANRTCSTCHSMADPKAQHQTLEVAHQRCDACHTGTTIAQLTPTRSFCSTCHVPKATNHYDQKECTTCHFLADPGVYRSKLTTASR